MAKIVKVIEVLSESPNSWEEAAKNVVADLEKAGGNKNVASAAPPPATVEALSALDCPTDARSYNSSQERTLRQ